MGAHTADGRGHGNGERHRFPSDSQNHDPYLVSVCRSLLGCEYFVSAWEQAATLNDASHTWRSAVSGCNYCMIYSIALGVQGYWLLPEMSAPWDTDAAVVEFWEHAVRENLSGIIYCGIRGSHGRLGES